ncbi:diacylglycerol O-acyltransferase 1 [Coniosporium apollinis]|uniref:diacylglycerol O-acyltransferase n=1 Tax=Coniosporium apollinis TaxID=61459 RepID=A0ABQ9P2E4_9PEZI|nr:diacylglycerol O-acyltransferase 1 [Coniosporium apollinis]
MSFDTDYDLPPKTYLDATVQDPNGIPIPLNVPKTNGIHEVSESHLDSNGAFNAIEEQLPEPQPEPVELNGSYLNGESHTPNEYTGAGLDCLPRSPTRKGHNRRTSRQHSSPKHERHEKESSNENNIIYEKFEDRAGDRLMSVKPDDEWEKALRLDEKEKKPKSQAGKDKLASGRQAGTGWDRSAIRFAPLNIPLKRRLQTLAVLMHTLSIALMLTTFFLLCSIPLLWPLLIPYLLFCLFSRAHISGELSYRSERMRRLPWWSLFASYFPARLHRTCPLPPTRKYIFGYHPHGIISHGAFAAFATEALGFGQLFPGITNTLLTLDSNFRVPLYRDYALRMGLASVSRESCENLLSRGGPNGEGMGRAITIVIGGARESLDAVPGHMRLVLNSRKGFVKLAIRQGADLVPVLAFGENDLYEQVEKEEHPWIHRGQLMVKKALGFTVPLFHARGVFNYDVGMMPYRRPVNIVVGKPVKVVRQERPDQGYVDQVHERYVEELVGIWDQWKDTFARDRQGELEIVD